MNADRKFVLFLEEWAAERGCNFIIENFDGRESPELIDGMAVDDVWGWLLPKGMTQRDDDYFGCAEWSLQNGKLAITWKVYEDIFD